MRTRRGEPDGARRVRGGVLLGVLWCAAASAAPAAPLGARSGALDLDPQRTVVHFTLPATLHEVHGTFRVVRGTVDVDAASGNAGGLVVVDAGSGGSGSGTRDAHMRDDVLDAAHFPEIRFRPEHVDGRLEPSGAFDVTLRGVLTLRGQDHVVSVAARGRLDGDQLTASGHIVVPYVAWGLPDPSILFLTVAKEVTLDVEAVGHVAWTDGGTR